MGTQKDKIAEWEHLKDLRVYRKLIELLIENKIKI